VSKRLLSLALLSSFLLTGCGLQPESFFDPLPSSSKSPQSVITIPPLTSENSIIDCSGWAQGAKTYLRQQGRLQIGETIYGIGSFACGLPEADFGPEFIESFVLVDQNWAANGLVSGPDRPFITTGPCTTANEIVCPATVFDYSNETQANGTLVIYIKDQEVVWRFDEN
jgi:hypothetical protein